MGAKRRQSADYLLTRDNYDRLNRSFYAATPADYFDQRLMNLLLMAGNPDGREELLQAGVKIGDLEYRRTAEDIADPEKAARAAEHFVIAEAEVLSHHIGETLLRLYLSHAGHPPCPPLALARTRTPSAFKKRVRERFVDRSPNDQTRLELAEVFHLMTDPTKGTPPIEQSRWDASLDNLESYLRHFANRFMKGAGLYNAAKHGLALNPGEASFEMLGSPLRRSGPAIQYLDQRDDSSGRRRWAETIHWVVVDRELALVTVALQLIEALWANARTRYVRDPDVTQVRVRTFENVPYRDLMWPKGSSGFSIDDLSHDLEYWRDPSDPADWDDEEDLGDGDQVLHSPKEG
jgi:hypothetical protein